MNRCTRFRSLPPLAVPPPQLGPVKDGGLNVNHTIFCIDDPQRVTNEVKHCRLLTCLATSGVYVAMAVCRRSTRSSERYEVALYSDGGADADHGRVVRHPGGLPSNLDCDLLRHW